MEDIQVANSNFSYEAYKEKNLDKSTLSSLKSSLSSVFHASLPRTSLGKPDCMSEVKSEEHSTEMCEEEIDEECGSKTVANFQKNYLELGQWPEVPVPVFQTFKSKYRGMKEKLKKCQIEKAGLEIELERYMKGEVPCNKCEGLKEKNKKTKAALEQAVQLSSILLKELKKFESNNNSITE